MTDRAPGEGPVAAVLAMGFGTALVMWLLGYLARLPGVMAPGPLVLAGLVAALAAGGFFVVGATGGGWRVALGAGFVASLVNLLVLGSLLADRAAGALLPSAALWIPGSLFAGCLVAAAGGRLAGARSTRPAPQASPRDWTGAFALVTVAATLSLLAVGGLVTSYDAGLAVADWPNSYGYDMFLYPLSRMTGGIYFEHAHRLFGSFVGLTTGVLAALLLRTDRRPAMRALGLLAFVTVVAQGILGGLRVTATSAGLALVHGVLAQVFFCLVAAIAVCRSRAWRSDAWVEDAGASTGRSLGAALVVALFMQLMLGAMQRHLDRGLAVHLCMALVVLLLAAAAGLRAWGAQERPPALRRIGLAVLGIGGLQLLLGFGALGVTQGPRADSLPQSLQAAVATAHQVTGAAFLAASVTLALLSHRLVRPPARAAAPATAEVTAS